MTLDDSRLAELTALLSPQRVLSAPEDLLAYGFDGTWLENEPGVVVFPESVSEVAAVHAFATRERLPITPRAMGSGLSGGSVPSRGGIVLNMTKMNRILAIDPVDSVAVVEPGVVNADLQTAVAAQGLFYPPDPSSYRQSAIGGNVAENAGGARCLKYGVTGDYVLALQVVLPDGRVIRTGGRSVKNVTGYNLRALFTGAEGTLGTITEITLRLLRKPRFEMTALAAFDRIGDAAHAVNAILASGVLPASIELLDRLTIECVEAYTRAGLPAGADAVLLIALDGNHDAALHADLATVDAALRCSGARGVEVAESAADRERLWSARRAVSPALARRRPNKLGEDIAVPRSAIPAMVARVREIAAKYDLLIPIFGHAGDGNLHPNILCDRRDAAEMERVPRAAREIFESAVEFGGTLSGEHGIGLLKRQFMELDLGTDALDVMRAMKAAIDPLNIMNPGKIFPGPGGIEAFRL